MAHDVNIEIKAKADTKALEQAKKEFEELHQKVGSAQANLGKFNAQANQGGDALGGVKNQVAPLAESFSSMGAAINLVNPQMGMMVQGAGMLTNGLKGLLAAMKTIITSPIALAIIAATAAFAYLKKELDKANAAVKELVAGLGKAPGVAERNAKVKRSYDEMARSIENVNDKIAHQRELEDMVIANGRAQREAVREYGKQKELAGAATERERQEIEDRYTQLGIEDVARQRREDISRNAQVAYSDADAANYAKMREQSQKEIVAQKGIIAGIEGQIMTNKEVVSGNLRTGSSFWNWVKSGFSDSAAISKEDQKAASKNIQDLIEQMKEAQATLASMEANAAKNEREESQAKEKRAQILRELTVVEAEAKAQQESLNTQIKQREKAEAKARAEAERGVADIIKDDAKQGAEWQWGRDYNKADTETKKQMLDAKIKQAQAEAEKARKEMEEAAKGEPNDEANRRRLADAQKRFTENQGMARSAQSSLDALNEQKGGVLGFKLSDRLSAMGGFATAGAKAVSGIFANTTESKVLREAEKQTKQGEEIKNSVQNIERHTKQPQVAVAQ